MVSAGYLGGSILARTKAPSPSAQLSGMIYVCDGLIKAPADSGCPAEHAAPDRRITFRSIGFFGQEVSSVTNRYGNYTVAIPPGHYRVSIEGCRRYVMQPNVAQDLNLWVADGTNDERGMPSLYWVIDSGGNCYQNPPLGL